MRKLNYRKKKAVNQGYRQIINNFTGESKEIELNGKDFTLFFEESKFYVNAKYTERIFERMETGDFSVP